MLPGVAPRQAGAARCCSSSGKAARAWSRASASPRQLREYGISQPPPRPLRATLTASRPDAQLSQPRVRVIRSRWLRLEWLQGEVAARGAARARLPRFARLRGSKNRDREEEQARLDALRRDKQACETSKHTSDHLAHPAWQPRSTRAAPAPCINPPCESTRVQPSDHLTLRAALSAHFRQ